MSTGGQQADSTPFITMKALEYHGTKKLEINTRKPKPMVTESTDAVIRVTMAAICGSDLHIYNGKVPAEDGTVLGHETIGIVESLGSNVKDIRVGQRVVVSCFIADGTCHFCQDGNMQLCDHTNDSKTMEKMHGDKGAGLFGYSHLFGSYDGGQAEYLRVPFADVNCLPVPDTLSDEKVIMLSDVLCTAYDSVDKADIESGKVVAVWGCGPIGLMALAWARYRGAETLIAIDGDDGRLAIAQSKIGAMTINYRKEKDIVTRLQDLTTYGPDVCIDAVGFRYSKNLLSKLQTALKLESDSADTLSEIIMACKKGGTIVITGSYSGMTNQFPIGALMSKGLTVKSGHVNVQKHWKHILGILQKGEFDPTFLITHRFALEEAPKAYEMFDQHEENLVKAVLYVGRNKPVIDLTQGTSTAG